MHLLIRSDMTFIRSYTIKIPLIRSYTIKISLIRSYTIKIPLIRSYTIKIPLIKSYTIKIPLIRSYTIKIPLIRSYTCQSDKEKNILYGLVRLIRHCKNDFLSGRDFLRSGDYQTRLKLFFQRPKLSWTAKFSHSTQLKLTLKLPPKQNQQAFFFIIG